MNVMVQVRSKNYKQYDSWSFCNSENVGYYVVLCSQGTLKMEVIG
jgi:hypothetical protein